jgi:hypothetical protein
MPDEPKPDEPLEEPIAGDDPPPVVEAPKAPEPDPRDKELEALRAALTKGEEREQRIFNALAANRNAGNIPADDTPKFTVTEDDIEAAVEAGDNKKAARLTRQMIREETAAATDKLRREAIDPINQQIGGYGMPAISALVREVVARDPKLKHFDRLRGGIEKHLVNLTAEAQINPEVVKAAYYHEVGANYETLVEEEIERRARKATPNPGGGPTPGRAGRSQGNNAIPTVEQLYGEELAKEVDRKGGPDLWAKKMGYKDWPAYVKETMGGTA